MIKVGDTLTRKENEEMMKIHYARIDCRIGSPTTNDKSQVTCGICLRRLAKLVLIPGPIEYRDGIPVFACEPKGRWRNPLMSDGTRLPDGCYLVFTCPLCGTQLAHGGIYGKPGDGDGHRSAHCNCWPNGYYLREHLKGIRRA